MVVGFGDVQLGEVGGAGYVLGEGADVRDRVGVQLGHTIELAEVPTRPVCAILLRLQVERTREGGGLAEVDRFDDAEVNELLKRLFANYGFPATFLQWADLSPAWGVVLGVDVVDHFGGSVPEVGFEDPGVIIYDFYKFRIMFWRRL